MPTIKKTGEKITWKEAFIRFKRGVDEITPIQKLTNEYRSSITTLIGYLAALIAVIINIEKIGLLAYGLILIFIGSLWSSGVKVISYRQTLKFLNNQLNDFEEKKEVENGKIEV